MPFDVTSMAGGARRVGLTLLLLAVAATSGRATPDSSPGRLPSVAGQGREPPVLGGSLPGPLPLLPPDNWWNQEVAAAPLDPRSDAFIAFINNGGTRRLHPDFGGFASPGGYEIYGLPYILVSGDQPKRAVEFDYWSESDGVDYATGRGVPFYPIPDEAIVLPTWIEGGEPGNVDQRDSADRHMLIVDRDRRHLYELYNVFFDGSRWLAGSGAFFDLTVNGRRPEGWTSADAAGLAILPGLVRYDEVYGPDEIRHAFRVTVRATNGYVYPASHRAGANPQALPMGARLRLKPETDISAFPQPVQKIFRAMKTHGLIVADNGSDMFVSGTFDPRWDNEVLNPAFGRLGASDFEVVELGWRGGAPPPCATPAAPRQLEFWTRDLTATLSWQPPASGAAARSYVLEAGSFAGGFDLVVTDVGPVTSLTASAPPGRYFVRMRAANACGAGPASNEIVVTLP